MEGVGDRSCLAVFPGDVDGDVSGCKGKAQSSNIVTMQTLTGERTHTRYKASKAKADI